MKYVAQRSKNCIKSLDPLNSNQTNSCFKYMMLMGDFRNKR